MSITSLLLFNSRMRKLNNKFLELNYERKILASIMLSCERVKDTGFLIK